MIEPKEISKDFLQHFFSESLLNAPSYGIDTPSIRVKLDQNESPVDWPKEFKQRVFKRAESYQWNRYPSPFADTLVKAAAKSIGLHDSCLLLGPGSNYLISLLMSTICQKMEGDLYIARPSFALYEAHARYDNIPYKLWELDDNLEYDIRKLDTMRPYSVVVFATPNNPVGNVLRKDDLVKLLKKHPTSIFVADEAYYEFADENLLNLLSEFQNLVIIRTFSKAMGAAGIRQGYLAANPAIIHEVKKPRVPYLINHFGIAAMLEVFDSPDMLEFFADTVKKAKGERDRIYQELAGFAKEKGFMVKNSQANSVLVKWPSPEKLQKAYQGLIDQGILVRNVSKGPGLAGCLRISVGLPADNDAFLAAAKKFF